MKQRDPLFTFLLCDQAYQDSNGVLIGIFCPIGGIDPWRKEKESMILGKMGLKAPKLHQALLVEGATDLAPSCSRIYCGIQVTRQLSPSPVGYLDPKTYAVIFVILPQKLQVLSGLSLKPTSPDTVPASSGDSLDLSWPQGAMSSPHSEIPTPLQAYYLSAHHLVHETI